MWCDTIEISILENCSGPVLPACVDNQLPVSVLEPVPRPEAVPLIDADMPMVCGIDASHNCMGHRYIGL